MGRAILAISSSAAGLLPHPFAGFGRSLTIFWRDLTGHLFDDYRPERHYMRGPGPAWRAKHGDKPQG